MNPPPRPKDETASDAERALLRLYNTLTRRKEDFKPIDPKAVRMYVCGPTVYDFAHIGNARPVIVFDILFRLLRHLYGENHVVYTRNITDVDDKINARAARDFPALPLNEAIAKVTEATERQFHEDVAALGCLDPTREPRATQYIDKMRAMIERLIARGVAYVAEDHVLFSPSAMDALKWAPRYGTLAHRSRDEMLAGARVDVAPYKREPMDFVLWKPSKPNEPGWPSPAGIAAPGRPGWHIECSAMSMATLLEPFGGGLECDDPSLNTFDIHGGGIDLVFPHHENEIAQSCSAFHSRAMANVWMHNGFLQVEGEKMAKSAGNFVTIHDLLLQYPGSAIRLNMLRTHYRQPIDWTREGLASAADEIRTWAEWIVEWVIKEFGPSVNLEKFSLDELDGMVRAEVIEAISDDLNTPLVITILQELFELVRNGRADPKDFIASATFIGLRDLHKPGYYYDGFSATITESGPQLQEEVVQKAIGYRAATANSTFSSSNSYTAAANQYKYELEKDGFRIVINDAGVLLLGNKPGDGPEVSDLKADFEAEIESLVSERKAARARKDWGESDRLRGELDRRGVLLKDAKDGSTTWKYKSSGSSKR